MLTTEQKLQMAVETLEHIAQMVCFSEMVDEPKNAECNCFSCSARNTVAAITFSAAGSQQEGRVR